MRKLHVKIVALFMTFILFTTGKSGGRGEQLLKP